MLPIRATADAVGCRCMHAAMRTWVLSRPAACACYHMRSTPAVVWHPCIHAIHAHARTFPLAAPQELVHLTQLGDLCDHAGHARPKGRLHRRQLGAGVVDDVMQDSRHEARNVPAPDDAHVGMARQQQRTGRGATTPACTNCLQRLHAAA